MRNTIIILIAITALFLFSGCSDDETTSGATRSLGSMNGHVITIIDDSPIPDATIEIWSVPITTFPDEDTVGGEIKVTTLTGFTGMFDAPVPVGKIWIRANADGFKRTPPQYWSLSPDSTGTLNFVLYPGEGDQPFDPPEGFDVIDDGDGQKAFDPCFPGFEREGPHDDRQCGDD